MKTPAPRPQQRNQKEPDPLLKILQDTHNNTNEILDLLDPPQPEKEEEEEPDPYEEMMRALAALAQTQAQIKSQQVDLLRLIQKVQRSVDEIKRGRP